MIPTNIYQTQLSDDYLDSLKDEVRDELLVYIANVPFIRNLINPNRKYAKDLERKDGKIIVDLCNPHILENMDYFRQSALYFKKHGVYTHLRPNGNKNSEFGRWLRREVLRCLTGMVRPSDGEWITGDLYFYLNYFPMIQSRIRPGTKIAYRVVDFPEVWEGVYWRFHYWDQARNGGLYNEWKGAEHAAEVARRGASKSYTVGSRALKNFILGESIDSTKKVKSILTAFGKEYLIKDGTLNKFMDGLNFCTEHTQFPTSVLKSSISDMQWKSGYHDMNLDVDKGLQNEVLAASSKDNPDVLRGKRCNFMAYEEYGKFPNFLDAYQVNLPNVQEGEIVYGQAVMIGTGGCVCKGTKIYKTNSEVVNVEDLKLNDEIFGFDINTNKLSKEVVSWMKPISNKECLEIITNTGRILKCSIDHPIAKAIKDKTGRFKKLEFIECKDLSIDDKIKCFDFKNNNSYLEKIKSIKSIGILPIYNFTTSNTHTYIANGIVTHNTEGADFAGVSEMIYHPKAFNVYGLPNVWDKGDGSGRSIWIFPQYVNSKGYYNEDGVSDVVGALVSELNFRYDLKHNSTDLMQLLKRKAEYGITIQEMIMRRDGTIFPVSQIVDRLNELDTDPKSFDDVYVGRLNINKNGDIEYKLDSESKPIMSYPLKDNKAEGAIQFYKMPVRGIDGRVERGRYIAGSDVYDDDASNTMSLGSILVLDLYTDEIVCEYTGRPMFADEFYEICRRILLFYNAECNYENNKKGIFSYFSRNNSIYLLSATLESLKDKDMMSKNLYGNKAYGTLSTLPIKNLGRRLIRDWLIKPTTIVIEENGEEKEVTYNSISKLKTRALLQELSLWNIDQNFDRVDALVQLMLLRDDKMRIFGCNNPKDIKDKKESDNDYEGNDEFFKRNYDERFDF